MENYRKMLLSMAEDARVILVKQARIAQETRDIYDLMAMRVTHATPKSNMYRSLHTTVFGPGGRRYEIQVRTEEMHRTSEYGIAAHWRCKEKEAVEGGGEQVDGRIAPLSRELRNGDTVEIMTSSTDIRRTRGDGRGPIRSWPRSSAMESASYEILSDDGAFYGVRRTVFMVRGVRTVRIPNPHGGDGVA